MPTRKLVNPDQATPDSIQSTRIVLGILIVLCLGFIISYAGRLAKKAQLQAEVAHWEERIEQANQRRVVLEAERQAVDSDAYVQKKARDELGMAQPGDSIIVVIPSTPMALAAPVTNQPQSTKVVMEANWEQWFALFVPQSATVRSSLHPKIGCGPPTGTQGNQLCHKDFRIDTNGEGLKKHS